MTKSVIATVAVEQKPLPADSTYDHIALVLTDSAGTAQTGRINGADELSFTFNNVAEGDATITAQAIDTANNGIGDVFTVTFTVVPDVPPSTFPQPVSIVLS